MAGVLNDDACVALILQLLCHSENLSDFAQVS